MEDPPRRIRPTRGDSRHHSRQVSRGIRTELRFRIQVRTSSLVLGNHLVDVDATERQQTVRVMVAVVDQQHVTAEFRRRVFF